MRPAKPAISNASEAVTAVPTTLPSSRKMVERTAELNAIASTARATRKRIHTPPFNDTTSFRKSALRSKSAHLPQVISQPKDDDNGCNNDQYREVHALQRLQQQLPMSPKEEADRGNRRHPQRRAQKVK